MLHNYTDISLLLRVQAVYFGDLRSSEAGVTLPQVLHTASEGPGAVRAQKESALKRHGYHRHHCRSQNCYEQGKRITKVGSTAPVDNRSRGKSDEASEQRTRHVGPTKPGPGKPGHLSAQVSHAHEVDTHRDRHRHGDSAHAPALSYERSQND